MSTLAAPSDKEVELLLEWDSVSQESELYAFAQEGYRATDEVTVAQCLGISKQAAIARLSSLVRKGWLHSEGKRGYVYWYLADAGYEALEYLEEDN